MNPAGTYITTDLQPVEIVFRVSLKSGIVELITSPRFKLGLVEQEYAIYL